MLESKEIEADQDIFGLGQREISFPITRFSEGGFVVEDNRGIVEAVAGGGFCGKVLLFDDYVVKTTQPDTLHEILREKNWEPLPFPPRSSNEAARREYLAGRIIHTLFESLSDGSIVTPNALGYTHFNGVGHGQVIEKMEGRGAVFNDGGVENDRIVKARQDIWEIGLKYGIEHAAQVHPNNPFGRQNVWINGDEQTVWLDYLPAIPHKGRVWPFYNFEFHNEVRDAFGQQEPTFNTIHTDQFRASMEEQSEEFTDDQSELLEELLQQYDIATDGYSEWLDEDPNDLFVQDLAARGEISDDKLKKLMDNPAALKRLRTRRLADFATRAGLEMIKKSPVKVLWDKEARLKTAMFLKHSETRQQITLEKTVLRGIKAAEKQGLVSSEEYSDVLSFLSDDDLKFYAKLQIGYLATSFATDIATLPVAYAASKYGGLGLTETGGFAVAFNTLVPGAIRAPITLLAGRRKNKKLGKMAAMSAVPKLGAYLTVPVQLAREYADEGAEEVLHYTERHLVASLSSLFADGGWHSDTEAKWWFESKIVGKARQVGDWATR